MSLHPFSEAGEPQILRRPSNYSRAFLPRPEQQVTLERNVLQPTQRPEPQTKRQRDMVGDLPDWEPMPPGEITIERPKAKASQAKNRSRRT